MGHRGSTGTSECPLGRVRLLPSFVAMALLLALSIGPSRARADEPSARPHVFYILSRLAMPRIDPGELPAEARPSYQRVLATDARLMALAHNRPIARVDYDVAEGANQHASTELEQQLARHARELEGTAWLVYGEMLFRRSSIRWMDEMDAMSHADEHGDATVPEPQLDFTDAIAAYQQASARSGGSFLGAWARYFEAHARTESASSACDAQALVAFSIVAAEASAQVAADARLRLGECAFEQGRWGLAAAWYRRAAAREAPERLARIINYKLAWALWLAGDWAAAQEVISRMDPDVPDEIRAELELLRVTPP